jgi:FixJ family two-component response regulator
MEFTRPRRRAILVEDYLPLRTFVAEALTTAGFDVSAFENSRDALVNFTPLGADVLITDIDLPQRPNGVELATIMHAQDQGLAIVFLTNFSEQTAFAATVTPPPHYAFLQKVYLDSSERLLETIESALADTEEPVRISEKDASLLNTLTGAQMEVVRMLASGLTNAEIASRRGTNQRATERMIYRLFSQLGLTNDTTHNPRVVLSNLYTRSFGYPALDSGD